MQLVLADGSRVNSVRARGLMLTLSPVLTNVPVAAGEAFFEVHKDAKRAFRVHALDGVSRRLVQLSTCGPLRIASRSQSAKA